MLFPLEHPEVWDMYKQAEASFWTLEELDFGQDLADWAKLTEDERNFLLLVLAFFAGSDLIVNANLLEQFMQEVTMPEARAFYGFQVAMETIHSEVYASLIMTYVQEEKERRRLFGAIESVPSIKKKADWCARWTDPSTASFGERLVAFACCEGIFFSSAFAAIFYFKKRGLLPGLTFANELISRDEGLHCDFACQLYDILKHKPDNVRDIVGGAVAVERAFVQESLDVAIIGMNADLMIRYVEFVADHLLEALDHDKLYHVENPFDFMDMISLQGKTNFFEKRVGEYAKAGVGVAQDERHNFRLDEEF